MTPLRARIKSQLIAAVTVLPLLSLVFTAAFWITDRGPFLPQFVIALVITEVTSATCIAAYIALSRAQRRFFAWRRWLYVERSRRVWMIRVAPFMIPGMWLGFRCCAWLAPYMDYPWQAPDLASWRNGVVFGVLISSLGGLLDFRREANAAKAEAAERIRQLETANLRAQVAALTAQMNPHLLFNALNSIASLIDAEPAAAERMTVGLASLYRKVLAAAQRETHTLADELDLVRAYLEVERGRFGERLAFAVDVAAQIDAKATAVPVLCLQPFVENAVKHGLMSRSEGGHVWVRVARTVAGALRLEVEDDGVGLGGSRRTGGSGTALANCRERLRLLYGGGADVALGAREAGAAGVTDPAGTLVRIHLPDGAGT